jgi:hypothetical protein
MAIFLCVICDTPVKLEQAVTDNQGKAAHLACLEEVLQKAPNLGYISLNPIAVSCPRCQAVPGDACQVVLDIGRETIHIERITAAAAMDVVGRDHYGKGQSNPSN